MPIRKVWRKENIHILSLLMSYETRKNMIFKVLSSVFNCIIENYVCADYLCCTQTKLHVADKVVENTTYNGILGIGIPEI